MTNTYLAISFFVTNADALRKLREQWTKKDDRYLGRTKKETEEVSNEELGGAIILLDPNNLTKGIIKQINIPVPMGMAYHAQSDSLLVASDYDVYSVVSGKYTSHISHNLFNNLHSVSTDLDGNILVTSSGVDGILEFTPDGKSLTWSWLASHHGYTKAANGKDIGILDATKDYRNTTIPTSEQSTHVNSAIYKDKQNTMATFFHQGELVQINKLSKKMKVISKTFRSPHNIRKTKNGYLLSDTLNNKVILFDHNFSKLGEVENNYNWVQDAIEIDELLYIADANNGRLSVMSTSMTQVGEFKWDQDSWKIGGLATIPVDKMIRIFG